MINWDFYKKTLGQNLVEYSHSDSYPLSPSEILTDSRKIQKGRWFLALKGETFDGHDYIQDAIKLGAKGVILHQKNKMSQQVPYLLVKDTLKAYQDIAKGWRELHLACKFVSLTGSLGKTTTKEFLRAIFEHQGPTLATSSNENNDIGVPLTLLRLEERHQFCVVEIGARYIGDIKNLNPLVKPHVAICLNALGAHQEIFGNKENIFTAKWEIFDSSPSDAFWIYPADDERFRKKFSSVKKEHAKSFGFAGDADVKILSVDYAEPFSMVVHIEENHESFRFKLPYAHEAYPIILAACVAAARSLNLSFQDIQKGITNFKPLKGRFCSFQSKNGMIVVDDTYNAASPKAVEAGLLSLLRSYPEKKKVLILGDMLELGSDSRLIHADLGRFVHEKIKPSFVITVGSQSIQIQKQLQEIPGKHFSTVDDLIASGFEFHKYGDIIYAKGSRGIKLDKMINELS